MDSEVELYLNRARDELLLAKINFNISTNSELKRVHNIEERTTFFNDVISESYYAIFYAAKAYLFSKVIKTSVPNEHKKTFEAFKSIVEKGILDKELLRIYDVESDKAEILLKIFFKEKSKRGRFVYNVKSEANLPYARESIENARKFISSIKAIIKL